MVPVLNRIYEMGPGESNNQPRTHGRRKMFPIALILAPTRELAQQIYDEARKVQLLCTFFMASMGEMSKLVDKNISKELANRLHIWAKWKC